MSNLENGMLVQHTSLGLGKVVALEPKAVHVFFATSDARLATKLRLPTALQFLTPADVSNAWLSGLSDFALDAKSGRYRVAVAWMSHPEAVARFHEVFPQGFADPAYLAESGKHDRVHRWRRAHEVYVKTLGGGEGERLLANDDVDGLVERALGVERHVRALLSVGHKGAFAEALVDRDAARAYFRALFQLLSAEPTESRFEALAAAVAAMSRGEAGWQIATLLPFVASPDVHMLLQPRFTCVAAQRLGIELSYQPDPGWGTYAALRRSTADLLERLRPLGASDHVDVEAFMHVATSKAAAPRKPALRLAT